MGVFVHIEAVKLFDGSFYVSDGVWWSVVVICLSMAWPFVMRVRAIYPQVFVGVPEYASLVQLI